MGEHSEVYVAFDTAKLKHAVAVAEGGRGGEVRFVGEIENRPATIEKMIARSWPAGTGSCTSASRRGQRDTGFIGRCRPWAMTARWWPQR